MSTKSNKPRRALATLKLPRNVPALIAYAIGIADAMTGNAYFTSPNPPIASLQTGIDALQATQITAQTRAHGAATLRDEKKAALVTLLEQARTYVQSTADANPKNASSIIQSAGVALRKAPVRAPRGFQAKRGPVSGSVQIVAPAAAARASYEWQYSTDGGKTWVRLPSTLQSRTSMTGLAPQTTVQFRYRALVKTGEGDWSAPSSLFVL